MSSHHTVPASELKRCSASTAVAPETKETSSATTAPSSHRRVVRTWLGLGLGLGFRVGVRVRARVRDLGLGLGLGIGLGC